MKDMFSDDGCLIQYALDEPSDATHSYMAGPKAEQAVQNVHASKLELTPSQQVMIARKYADGEFACVLECPTLAAFRPTLGQCGDRLFKF